MTQDKIFDRLQDVFRTIFKKDTLEITHETTAKDIKGWDSFQHIQLILAVEKAFSIKFKNTEIAQFKCVGDMIKSLEKKEIS